MRPKPAPQEAGTGLNANIPKNVKERLEEDATASDQSVSALLTSILREHYGIRPIKV